MKFCYACGYSTRGEPSFCNSCGASYDLRLCPKLHVNPRTAQACSQCGSRDLSSPQPKVPVFWRFLAVLVQAITALLLFRLSLPALAALLQLLSERSTPGTPLVARLFAITNLWILWAVLPDIYRRIMRRFLIQKSGLTHESK